MKWPKSLVALVDYGIIDEVLRPLMSGKEAQVYLVRCGSEERVAKVYKEADGRSFRQRADYTEGRRTRNSRDQRALDKRTRHGRAQDEQAWRVTEVDRIRRLRAAGVRVPLPHEFVDGVFVMELVTDAEGHPAPRLGDLSFSAAEAGAIYDALIRETVRMLAADIVHGDLSEFNVLMAADGPVLIDFPQAVDPASNRNARSLLLRDVKNLHRFLLRFAPGHEIRLLGEEMWKLYEEGKLRPDSILRGSYRAASGPTNTSAVVALIEDARRDALRERNPAWKEDAALEDEPSERSGLGANDTTKGRDARGDHGPALRRVVDFTKSRSEAGDRPLRPRSAAGKSRSRGQRKRTRNRSGASETQGRPAAGAGTTSNEPKRGRRRTRRARKPTDEGRTPSRPRSASPDKDVRHRDQAEDSKTPSGAGSSGSRKRSRRRRRRRGRGRPNGGGSQQS